MFIAALSAARAWLTKVENTRGITIQKRNAFNTITTLSYFRISLIQQ